MKRTRKDLINELVSLGITAADAKRIVDNFIEIITDALKSKEEVRLKNFGKFILVRKRAREFTNPKTKEIIKIPDYIKIRFIPSVNLKNFINER